jgi:hypothetical protein
MEYFTARLEAVPLTKPFELTYRSHSLDAISFVTSALAI